jgi:hypothetical protein
LLDYGIGLELVTRWTAQATFYWASNTRVAQRHDIDARGNAQNKAGAAFAMFPTAAVIVLEWGGSVTVVLSTFARLGRTLLPQPHETRSRVLLQSQNVSTIDSTCLVQLKVFGEKPLCGVVAPH